VTGPGRPSGTTSGRPGRAGSAPRRVARRGADALLTVAAVVGVLGFGLFVLVRLGVVQPLVVTSGSMRPTYEIGTLVVSRAVDATELAPGDIATLRSADDRLITHRVVSASAPTAEGVVTVVMRGDANDDEDPIPYVVTRALVPITSIPRVGPVVAVVQRPSVALPGLVAVVALVAIAFVPVGRDSDDDAQEAAGDAEPGRVSPGRGATGPRHARR